MDKFQLGTVCYHLATSKRCVVLQIDKEKNLVKVRTQNDEERDYYPHELKTQQEVDYEAEATSRAINAANEARARDLDPYS